MSVHTACEALRSGHVLELIYDGYSRFVEVHDVGFTEDDNPIMRAWQVRGGIGNSEPIGWKLLRLDEASEAIVTHQRSLAPREGYSRKRENSPWERLSQTLCAKQELFGTTRASLRTQPFMSCPIGQVNHG
jgi:hypothetical protein